MSGAPFIALSGVHKAFGGREVLRGVDLHVEEGETLVILGGSGSGKSVTLRHVIGLTAPDEGRVVVDGQDVQELSEKELVAVRRKVGFLFQGGALFDSMDIADNIAFPMRQLKRDPATIRRRIDEVLELVDLPLTVAAQQPSDLSGGMRKRAALARAIAVEPRAILYDEPTTGLDPVTANTINDLIRSMQARLHVTSIVVTHDIDSAFRVGDRVAFLHEGRIRFSGSVEEARRTDDPLLRDFLAGRSTP